MKNAMRTFRLVTTGRVVQVAQAVLALAVSAACVAKVPGVAFFPVPELVQVICSEAIGIVLPPEPVIGPAGDVTVSVAVPADVLRKEPVTVVVEQAK